MTKSLFRRMLCAVAAIFSLSTHGVVHAQTVTDQLRAAHINLEVWVGAGENGQNWRSFLMSSDLDSQLNRAEPDFATLVRIHGKYASGTPGLEMEPFVRVRAALENWLYALVQQKPEQIANYALASKESFRDLSPDRAAKATQDLNSALIALDQFIVSSSGTANAAAWHDYLLTETLKKQIADKPDLAILNDVLLKYAGDKPGQELPQFMNVRSALRTYVYEVSLSRDPNPKQTYVKILDDLAKRLEAYAKAPTSEDAIVIGQSIGWLRRAGQAGWLLPAVTVNHWKPNVYAMVSARLMNSAVSQPVNDTTQVNEDILGTAITGTAHTLGMVQLIPVTDGQRASFDLQMTGTTATQNVGYKKPVTIYSHGCAQVFASKRLCFDMDGLRSNPAFANVDNNTTIDGVATRLRIIEKMAWKKIGQSKAQAEAIGEQRAEAKLAQRMDSQSLDLLSQANRDFREKVITPLHRRDVYPHGVALSTTPDALNVQLTHVEDQQIAAPTLPPLAALGNDLTVQFHESSVGNYSESIIGGIRFTDVRIAELVKEATGNVPKELEITEETDPWAITFVTGRPLSVKLDNNEATIRLHIHRLERGEDADAGGVTNVRLVANYAVQQTPAGAKLVRKGDLDVEFPDHKGTLKASQIAVKAFLRLKFGTMFKPEIDLKGLEPKGRFAKIGKLVMNSFASKDGWGTISWNAVTPPPAPISTVNVEEQRPTIITVVAGSE